MASKSDLYSVDGCIKLQNGFNISNYIVQMASKKVSNYELKNGIGQAYTIKYAHGAFLKFFLKIDNHAHWVGSFGTLKQCPALTLIRRRITRVYGCPCTLVS